MRLQSKVFKAAVVLVCLIASQSSALAQTPVVFDFENLAATYSENANPCVFPPRSGLLSTVSMTVSGLTVGITRVGANFDIVANSGCQSGKPGSWGARSLDPFVFNASNTPFNLNFSAGIVSFSVQWGDYGTDADNVTLTAFSGLNGTGVNLGSVTSATYSETTALPTVFTTSISVPSSTPIRSIRMIGTGSTGFFNSIFYDNITIQSTQLTVSGTGNGVGTVATPVGSSPIINCTSTAGATSGTCQQTYDSTAQVTLIPTPETGSMFAGWSGACTGTGACVVTMSQARDVTAMFIRKRFRPSRFRVAGTGSGTVTSQAGADAGDQLHDHERRGLRDVLAELPPEHVGDADGRCDRRRLVRRLGWHVHRRAPVVHPLDDPARQRHRELHGAGAADADDRCRRIGQRDGDVPSGR